MSVERRESTHGNQMIPRDLTSAWRFMVAGCELILAMMSVLKTYIDESGVFRVGGPGPDVSVVVALTVPHRLDSQLARLLLLYARSWGVTGEVKGRDLGEKQTAEFINALARLDVVLDAVCLDSGLHTPSDVQSHQAQQAAAIAASVTPALTTRLTAELLQLAADYKALSAPLYLQAISHFSLVESVVRQATLYYSQRSPDELRHFEWIVDTKGSPSYEALWSRLLLPALEWCFHQEPLGMLDGANYRAFGRYRDPDQTKARSSLNDIWACRRFTDSASTPGLQVVDVLSSALRRALRGNLRLEGWENLGQLMLRRKPATLRFIRIAARAVAYPPRYNAVAEQLDRGAKTMLSPGRK